MPFADRLRVKPGSKVRLGSIDPGDLRALRLKPARGGLERPARAEIAACVERMQGLQYRLWAEHQRSLLIVLQGMDTSGKDGVVRHVFSGLNPQGVAVTSFKAPSAEELNHDFLWRIHAAAPGKGHIQVFNRSHYESVLVERVHGLVPAKAWKARYRLINDFERLLASRAGGQTTILKFFLHISKDEQRKRLQARVDDPERNWKFEPGDLEERKRWDDYTAAYEDALSQCSTDHAPWFVIPSDHKWGQRLAIARIVLETLEDMDPKTPRAALDPRKIVIE